MCLLGFGDHQYVVEQEEVSVLSLHPGLQLSMSVQEKRPIRAGEEGLDQWAGVWAHRNQEALSGLHNNTWSQNQYDGKPAGTTRPGIIFYYIKYVFFHIY